MAEEITCYRLTSRGILQESLDTALHIQRWAPRLCLSARIYDIVSLFEQLYLGTMQDCMDQALSKPFGRKS
jgi:hypothetical protein